jgi:hypothetical protein
MIAQRGKIMAKLQEIDLSSYQCECGHISHFFESTAKAMKSMSMKKKVFLADSTPDEHTIVFYKGKASSVLCPHTKKAQKNSGAKRASKKG